VSPPPDRDGPDHDAYCGLCGYPVGSVTRCESCGAFLLGHDWQGPDRLRVLGGGSASPTTDGPGRPRPDGPAGPGAKDGPGDPDDPDELTGRQP
jgi:hypothetical protein